MTAKEIFTSKRDNKSWIPFPNHWDLIGGHVEEGETPEKALVREVKEELDIDLLEYALKKMNVLPVMHTRISNIFIQEK